MRTQRQLCHLISDERANRRMSYSKVECDGRLRVGIARRLGSGWGKWNDWLRVVVTLLHLRGWKVLGSGRAGWHNGWNVLLGGIRGWGEWNGGLGIVIALLNLRWRKVLGCGRRWRWCLCCGHWWQVLLRWGSGWREWNGGNGMAGLG